MAKGWYTVHTYSGYEQKIEKLIRNMIDNNEDDFASVCLDVKVPFETLIENKDGERKEVKRKVLPGYILVEMELPEDDSWKKYCSMIKKIQGVTGFLTANRSAKPLPLSKEEMDIILQRTGEIKAEKTFRIKQSFANGETVKITDGPFAGFTGVIEEVNSEKAVLRVSVEIFGRPTPVEIDYAHAEKL